MKSGDITMRFDLERDLRAELVEAGDESVAWINMEAVAERLIRLGWRRS